MRPTPKGHGIPYPISFPSTGLGEGLEEEEEEEEEEARECNGAPMP